MCCLAAGGALHRARVNLNDSGGSATYEWQPHKGMVAQLSPNRPKVDSSLSPKSNLELSVLSPRNLGQAPSLVNNNGVYRHSPQWTNLRDPSPRNNLP